MRVPHAARPRESVNLVMRWFIPADCEVQMRRKLGVMFGCAMMFTACRPGDSPSASAIPATQQRAVTAQASAPGGRTDVTADTQVNPGKYLVIEDLSVMLTPTTEERVADPFKPGEISNNWVAFVLRGTAVNVERTESGWCFTVQERGGTEGWVKCSTLASAEGSRLVTVMDDTDSLDPLKGDMHPKAVEVGNYMIAVETRGELTRVALGEGAFAWVKTSALVDDAMELKVARLITRARRALDGKHPEDFRELWDKARIQYKDAKLTPILEHYIPLGDIRPVPALPTSDVAP